jgi:transposase-like protein
MMHRAETETETPESNDPEVRPAIGAGELSAQLKRLLPREDRELLELYCNNGVSLRTLARTLGCSHGHLSRRVQAMLDRLTCRKAEMIALRGHELQGLHYEVAVRRYISGESKMQIARALGVYPMIVRSILDEVDAWCDVGRPG